jgi:L-ectoine synthase
MIVKTRGDVVGTKGDKHGDKWHSLRFLHKDDGMGVTLTDTILDPGFLDSTWCSGKKTTSRLVIAWRARV